jgi:hypothetical protein
VRSTEPTFSCLQVSQSSKPLVVVLLGSESLSETEGTDSPRKSSEVSSN